jgi:hypothetical protein
LPHPKDLLANRPNRPLETNDAPFQIPTIYFMDYEQVPSLLLQLGISAIAAGLLYGLQLLIRDTDSDGRKHIQQRRDTLRYSTQQRITTISQTSVESRPLLAPDLSKMEVAVRESVAKVGISAGYPTSESMPSLVSFEISDVPKLEESSRALVTWT